MISVILLTITMFYGHTGQDTSAPNVIYYRTDLQFLPQLDSDWSHNAHDAHLFSLQQHIKFETQ